MTRRAWACVRITGVAAIAVVIAVRLGAGPFVTGLRSISVGTVAAAGAIAVVTTLCCAWRWWLVARGLGVPLRFGPAVLAYYRSQFLNSALPGGVLGDLHRGVRHGREAHDLSLGLRAVLWERSAAQGVQVCFVLVVACAHAVADRRRRAHRAREHRRGRPPRVVGTADSAALRVGSAGAVAAHCRSDLRSGVVAPTIWPAVVATSIAVFAGHVATFVIAARAVGVTESAPRLVPLAIFVLLIAALPANVGGWGPREGAAAWTFAVAGLSGAQGVAAATAYGVLAAAASLPGAIVLAAGWWTQRTASSVHTQSSESADEHRELVGAGSGAHG